MSAAEAQQLLEAELRGIAGGKAIDCGSFRAPPASAAVGVQCALDAYHSGHAFIVIVADAYLPKHWQGYAWSGTGNVTAIRVGRGDHETIEWTCDVHFVEDDTPEHIDCESVLDTI